MKKDMQLLPFDDVPVWCPDWETIKGKAHLYKTARFKSTGEYVALRGIYSLSGDPVFAVQLPGGLGLYRPSLLCGFVL